MALLIWSWSYAYAEAEEFNFRFGEFGLPVRRSFAKQQTRVQTSFVFWNGSPVAAMLELNFGEMLSTVTAERV